jgi:myo-inositol 2-dehydrogenase / D-chiro-inositol 1-dehydrogenase
MSPNDADHEHRLSRRDFVSASTAAASVTLLAPALGLAADAQPPAEKTDLKRKIKLGLVGGGGRGSWIAQLFKQHGGYEFVAMADYFPEVADRCGDALGVDKARRFSGLSAYRNLISAGVEAVVLQTPPYFFPEHAKAAAEAGCHVYMAKPVAVDVPGALAIEAAGKQATQKQRCFLVDYQMPTDPVNIEVAQRIREGGLGKIGFMATFGFCGGFADPPLTATIESRLQHLTWVNDVALGCDYLGNFDIHAIDAALWVAGQRPVSAAGASRICRPNPHGDARDVCSVVYEFADGMVLNHTGQGLGNNSDGLLACQVFGQVANAQVHYWGKAFVRGGPKHFGGGPVENLYEAGAKRNIAAFHQSIVEGQFDNPTVRRAVDGVLTCILGREAAARHARLTMDELLKENKRLEVDLKGLKD